VRTDGVALDSFAVTVTTTPVGASVAAGRAPGSVWVHFIASLVVTRHVGVVGGTDATIWGVVLGWQ
jgi:hypothetical protein